MDSKIPVIMEALILEGDMALLPPPLIPVPVSDLVMIDDVYIPMESSVERWRSFIDGENWDPRQFNDDLLRARAYHARMYWEYAILHSFTCANWLCIPTIKMVMYSAAISLRTTEFEILSYQLTCGMIGFIPDDREALWKASIRLYTTMLWLGKQLLDKGKKTKERRKQWVKLNARKPLSVDNGKELASKMDESIFTIKEMLVQGPDLLNQDWLEECVRQLKECIVSLDHLIKVI